MQHKLLTTPQGGESGRLPCRADAAQKRDPRKPSLQKKLAVRADGEGRGRQAFPCRTLEILSSNCCHGTYSRSRAVARQPLLTPFAAQIERTSMPEMTARMKRPNRRAGERLACWRFSEAAAPRQKDLRSIPVLRRGVNRVHNPSIRSH